MDPAQYTGKSGTSQGDPSAGRRRDPNRPRGNTVRLMIWGAVLVALIAGLVLYFRYEREVAALLGGPR